MEFTEVVRRRRMIRGFTTEPLPEGTADRLLTTASRAPSAGFSQGFSFLVLEGAEQCAPFWRLLYEQAAETSEAASEAAQVDALSAAPLVIVPMASKNVYLNRYAQPDKAWTAAHDEASWPVPYWYIDAGFATLLILHGMEATINHIGLLCTISIQRWWKGGRVGLRDAARTGRS